MRYSNRKIIKNVFNRIYLGKKKQGLTLSDLKKSNYTELNGPVFVLSTGRCRTHWLTNVLSNGKKVFVEHNPEINFLSEGKLIYENFDKASEFEPFISQLVQTARDKLFLECAKRKLKYVETNNRITFAAPIIKNLIPNSKFLHLTRNPVEFIISGRNRNWYLGDGHDLGRIVYYDNKIWTQLSQNQKIAWLWIETNKFILKHVSKLSGRYYFCASENLDINQLKKIFKFMGIDRKYISLKWLQERTNVQKRNIVINEQEILLELRDTFFYEEFKILCTKFGYTLNS